MCIYPCFGCLEFYYHSCTSCVETNQHLFSFLCITTPIIYYQIASIVICCLFIMPFILRKRSLTLLKIIDLIQLASYFKLINGYPFTRHIWLYLGMRSWGNWAEGWSLVLAEQKPPIWINEEGVINKTIRIVCTWGVIVSIGAIIGILKLVLDQKTLTFQKYIQKNLANICSFAYYFTLQDIAFVIAIPILHPNFQTTPTIISFVLSIIFILLTTIYIIWSFYRINYPSIPQQKNYRYKYLFLFSADYDYFPTYQLLDLPTKTKQIKNLSNIHIINMIKKIGYGFLIIGYLNLNQRVEDPSTYYDEMMQIIAYLIFFEIIWVLIMPYNIRKQYLQFATGIITFAITLYVLIGFWYIKSQLVNTIMVFLLFGLAFFSLVMEYFLNIYKLVPIDLYQIGLKITIDDQHLLKQLAIRKKQQSQMQKKIKQIELRNQKLKTQIQQRYQVTHQKNITNISNTIIQKNKFDSETSLKNKLQSNQQQILSNNYSSNKNKNQLSNNRISDRISQQVQQHVTINNQNNGFYCEQEQGEKDSMNSQDIADLYKIDDLKRRKVYQWNKQKPFVYSNRME